MTRLKLSLAAFAFVLATGAAFATNHDSKTTAACVNAPGRDSSECTVQSEDNCCIDGLGNITKGQFGN